jgi:hypothetical protein
MYYVSRYDHYSNVRVSPLIGALHTDLLSLFPVGAHGKWAAVDFCPTQRGSNHAVFLDQYQTFALDISRLIKALHYRARQPFPSGLDEIVRVLLHVGCNISYQH